MKIPELASRTDEVAELAAQSRTVWVSGPVGSGRGLLMRELGERHDIVPIPLLSLQDADATAHLAICAAAGVPEPAERRALLDAPWRDQPGLAGEALTHRGITALLRVPSSWTSPGANLTASRRLLAQHAAQRFCAHARVIVVADANASPAALGLSPDATLELPPHHVPFPSETWGLYWPHAQMLYPETKDLLSSPLVWRLAMGALALGASVPGVAARCRLPVPDAINQLVLLVGDQLDGAPADLQAAAAKFARIRRPLSRAAVLEVIRPPEEHVTLFLECFGYGDPVRPIDTVRPMLGRRALPPEQAEAAHHDLAGIHEVLDGVSDPANIGEPTQMLAWLEKVHHLGQSGLAGAGRWGEQHLPSPEFYWDRARHLSIQRAEYAKAADVYAGCLRRFPTDDYSAHYLAWNLEKARGDEEQIRASYALAVSLAPRVAWWNARYISHLIRVGRLTQAKRAWAEAVQRIDPDGDIVNSSPWLSAHLHYWVAEAWEGRKCFPEAKKVLDAVPLEQTCSNPHRRDFEAMRMRIEGALERERAALDSFLDEGRGPRMAAAKQFIARVFSEMPGIAVPAVAPMDSDTIHVVWSAPAVYLEVELGPGDDCGWFAKDRLTGAVAEGEDLCAAGSSALLTWLARVRYA